MAARPARADAQNPTPPPPLWPLLCSAVLVGMMIASEVRRAYRTSGTTANRPETGAFGTGRSSDKSSDKPAAAQHKRAQEFGRGCQAQAPWQIPWQGWKDILWRTYYQIGEDRLLAVAAAGVVFYGLLAVFPAVTALVSLYGLFASPSAISDQLSLLAGILPQVAWLISSALLSWYLASFADYDATYGSLGAAIGMMMWMWISAIVILFGAQLNSEIEHQTARDSTVRGERPLGARGAVVADTVGKAQ